MVNIFGNKHVFWQALILAMLIFWTGIILGVMFESSRASKLEKFYFNSETDIFDLALQDRVMSDLNLDCDIFIKESISFADKIYFEAKALEKYDSSSKISDDVFNLHRRYDLLRAMLWKNLINEGDNCTSKVNVVVFLYQYKNPSINIAAKQATFSKVLIDLKGKYGDRMILIPIAYDLDVKSLDLLMKHYELDEFPVIFINQKHKITELSSSEGLEKFIQ